MTEGSRQKAYAYLLDLAAKQEYITFDDIINVAEQWQLPLNEVDWLSNSISTRGVLVCDEAPEKTNRVEENDEVGDYSQCDYEAVFNRIVELEPSLSLLVDEVRKIKPPQYREMAGIIYQAKEGNEYAKNRIVEMHLRMALRIGLQRAEQYDADLVDCIGDACIGLIIAVDKYDPETSGAFGSYASFWMLQNVSRMQRTQRENVYYPVHKKEQYFTMYPILKDRGCTKCNEVWTCREARRIVQGRLECTIKQAEEAVLQILAFDSFDEMYENVVLKEKNIIYKQEERIYRIFNEKISVSGDIEDIIGEQEMQEEVNKVLNTLSEREQKVIRDRFGFAGGKEKTLEEVGMDLKVTRERIRQIEAKVLRKLRQSSYIRELRSYI